MIKSAKDVFEALKPKKAVFLGDKPDGLNINEGVGVMFIETCQEAVLKEGADFGVAFDGDGDRVLFVDKKGRLINGDLILWVLARWLKKKCALGSGVVATVMSNMALEEHLNKEGIPLFRCPVGDRYVYETMLKTNSLLGGEQSGHIIIKDYVQTGDGLCTSLMFLRACDELGLSISELNDEFSPYPQLLQNVRVSSKDKILSHPAFLELLRECERKIEGRGRVFVRLSGTEPMVRILLEAKGLDLDSLAKELVSQIHKIDKELDEVI
jgi:phosphoglucosamine mutase